MLFIHNETTTQWGIQELNNPVIRFSKTKTIKTEEKERVVGMSIIALNRLFPNMEELKKAVAEAVQTEQPVRISDENTSVIFNRKAYQPFVTSRPKNYKDILLATLDIKGKRIIEVYGEKAFLLEYLLGQGEFSFIIALNSLESKYVVKLLDAKKQKVTVYTFGRTEEGVVLEKTVVDAEETDKDKELRLKKFRPARPTHFVLVHRNDKQSLLEKIDQEQYTVVEFEKKTFEDVIKSLKDQNVRAVTYYADAPFGKVEPDVFRKYKSITDKLRKQFQTVFKLHNDGKVAKMQF